MTKNNEPHHYKKPPLWVQILLWAYGFMWLNMVFVTGLNSLYLGYIDYDSGSIAFAMTLSFSLFLPYLLALMIFSCSESVLMVVCI